MHSWLLEMCLGGPNVTPRMRRITRGNISMVLFFLYSLLHAICIDSDMRVGCILHCYSSTKIQSIKRDIRTRSVGEVGCKFILRSQFNRQTVGISFQQTSLSCVRTQSPPLPDRPTAYRPSRTYSFLTCQPLTAPTFIQSDSLITKHLTTST